MRLIRLISTLTLGCVLAIGGVFAVDTGTLVVKTTDKSGGALPGVTVEIVNAKGLSVPAPKSSDGAGTASFIVVAGQGYTCKVTMPGFSPQQVDFDIALGKTKTILFQMSEQLTETVKVKAKVVEIDEGGENKTSFTDNFVEDLPILGRSYQNVLTLAPGVNDSNNDGNPNVHGSRERDFKATVDGVSNVDPLTGQYMSNINPDAIEEIEVVTTGASAEYGGAVGGFGKIITKQGGNTFDGNASIYVRSSLFDGSSVVTGTDIESVTYHDVRPTLNLTGPIIKDTLFFALFHEYVDVGLPVALINGSSVVQVTNGSRNTDKLTWQVSPRNKMIFQVQADPLYTTNLGIDSGTSPLSGYGFKRGGPTYQVHWDTQVSSIMSIQSLVGFSHTSTARIPNTNGVKNACGVDQESSFSPSRRQDPFGTNTTPLPIDEDYCFQTVGALTSGSFWNDTDDDRIRYTVKSDMSYFLENFLGVSHTIKGGFIAEHKKYTAFLSRRPFTTFTEATISFAGAVGGEFEPGGGSLSRTVFYPGSPNVAERFGEGSNYGIYLEDQFRPDPNWSVRIGARVEQENINAAGYEHFDPAAESSQFDQGYNECIAGSPGSQDRCARANFHYFHTYELFPTLGNSPIRQYFEDPTVGLLRRVPEQFRISNTYISPRLSVSWDPGSDGKTKIFGTAGRYYGETFLAVPLFEQPPDAFNFIYSVNPLRVDQPNPDGDGTITTFIPVIEPDSSATVQPATVYQVDRNLKPAYQDEYTLGFQREIFQETSLTFTYIRRYFRDQFQDIDANHYAQDVGTVTRNSGCYRPRQNGPLVPINPHPDGIFDDCGGRTVVVPGAPPFFRPRRVEVPDGIPDLFIYNPFFNSVFRVGNYNSADYKAYQLELKRRLHRNWQLEASYVWSQAVGAAEDYAQALGDDPSLVQKEYGPLSFDQTHFLKVSVTTQVPLWNLRLSSSFSWESGLPFSIVDEQFSNDQARFFGGTAIQYGQVRTTYPTGARNDQRNSSYWTFDVGARKDWTAGKTNIEASLDVFNLINMNSLVIAQQLNNQTVGVRTAGRQFQVGAKVTF